MILDGIQFFRPKWLSKKSLQRLIKSEFSDKFVMNCVKNGSIIKITIFVFQRYFSTSCVDKQKLTYNDLFAKLIEKMRELCRTVQYQSRITNYELAVKNFFNKYFPRVNVRIRKMICLLY